MIVVMTSELFRASRHHGVLLPAYGESVELDDAGAESLIASGHAKRFEVAKRPVEADVETAAVEAPEDASERRGRGRPRKAAGE